MVSKADQRQVRSVTQNETCKNLWEPKKGCGLSGFRKGDLEFFVLVWFPELKFEI